MLEDNTRTFSGNWTGTATVVGSGDSERIEFASGQYMVSEVVETGTLNVILDINKYGLGNEVTLKYRHGATQSACEAASWNNYTGQFASLGYVQVRLEATI